MSTPPDIDLRLVRDHCYAAVISDCCDAVGLRDQALAAEIRPLVNGDEVLAGWARPALSTAVDSIPDAPYEREIDYIDSLGTDEVVVARCEGGAFWGELFSTAARARGAVGAVVDGLIRDRSRIAEVDGFVVHATGTHPTDSLGRCSITVRDEPIPVGGVSVVPGDLVVADVDGVVVVPRAGAEEVVTRALEKATKETDSRQLLARGALLREAWDVHRVL
jgi:4-hydroxy-4-methyl-2-oxoglutarate aldolase